MSFHGPLPMVPQTPKPSILPGAGHSGGQGSNPRRQHRAPPTPRRCSGTRPRGLGVGALSQRKWWEVRAPLRMRRIQTSAFPSGLPGARRAPPSLLAGLVWFQLPRAWPCARQVSPDLGSPPPRFLNTRCPAGWRRKPRPSRQGCQLWLRSQGVVAKVQGQMPGQGPASTSSPPRWEQPPSPHPTQPTGAPSCLSIAASEPQGGAQLPRRQ